MKSLVSKLKERQLSIAIYCVLALLLLQAFTLLVSTLMAFSPWVFPNALIYYFPLMLQDKSGYFATAMVIAFFLLGIIIVAAYLYYRGGTFRKVAQFILLELLLLTVAAWLADALYVWWEGLIRASSPTQVLNDFFLTNGLAHQHVIICLLAVPITLLIPLIATLHWWGDKSRSLHGNAHWASRWEAKKAGLLADEGIYLGKKWGQYLRSDGFEHVIVFAPSGGGKTRSVMIPTLLTNNSSIVTNDTKLELFKLTSQYRQMHGQQCFLFAPASKEYKTHRYNPFDFVPTDKINRIQYLQKIANILIPNPHEGTPFWSASSRGLLVAIALYLMDTPGKYLTFGEILRTVQREDFFNWLEETLDKANYLDPMFCRTAAELSTLNHETRSNILKTFTSYLELWDDPILDEATSASDFDIRNLRRERMTIYVGFTADDVNRLSPLLTLFWQQVLDFMTMQEPGEDEPETVLLLMDEFATLRRMEALKDTIGLLRSYHVRVVIVLQQISQVLSRYGQHDAKVFTDARIKLAFTQASLDDAKYVSEFLGKTTVRVRTQTYQSGYGDQAASGSESWSYQPRPLMLPEELLVLNENQVIVMSKGSSPILAQQSIWYKDPELKPRPCGESEVPVQTPHTVPFIKITKPKVEPKPEGEPVALTMKELAKEKAKANILAEALKDALSVEPISMPLTSSKAKAGFQDKTALNTREQADEGTQQ